MSLYATELCLLLVDDIYGGLTSRVFETLMCYGRLTFSALLQHTGLTSRQLKHSLVVLVQQHLALWFSSPEDEATHYEADWRGAYALARSGKLIKVVEDRYGDFAGGLVSNLLLSGHASISDLAQAYNLTTGTVEIGVSQLTKTKGSLSKGLTNGLSESPSNLPNSSLETFHESLITLLNDGFLSVVHESHFRSDADNRSKAESVVNSQERFQRALKAAEKEEYEKAVRKQVMEWKLGSDSRRGLIRKLALEVTDRRKKRCADDHATSDGPPEKRRRLSTGFSGVNGRDTYAEKDRALNLDETLIVRINNEKLPILARNEKLVKYVEQHIGQTTSRVYAELLFQLETSSTCCDSGGATLDELDDGFNDEFMEGSAISTTDLMLALKGTVRLTDGISPIDTANIDIDQTIHPKNRRRKKIKSEEAEVEGYASPDEEEDTMDVEPNGDAHDGLNRDSDYQSELRRDDRTESDPSAPTDTPNIYHLTQQHLLLLAEHPFGFVDHIPRRNNRSESWSVDYSTITRQILIVELENIIVSRYGLEALRIVRILQEKRKLDEKAIGSFALMNQKGMRSLLTRMHEAGHLELQEIPKDTYRQPSRTMFMWFFDPERCRQKVLEETYKTMARCMQRIRAERESIQGVIDKASRTDVVGKEEEFLGIDERTALEAWREKEERLLGEIGRLDDLVGVLRDF